ncbi:MAG: glyoxalase/bleomycin resistance/extradiol dioxygenase family protein [Moraxellaceae bacterium]|nr:MAG: glyoxalase/bleomycin resistance/extradiol dioxygenase family protein [Moraxellaceae bacterium]
MTLKLIVIRTGDLERLAKFYERLGFQLEYHKHGKSPYHYSGNIADTVLEIYPLAKDQHDADKHFRVGIGLENFDQIIAKLKVDGVKFIMDPTDTDFGFMAIVSDPDSRKVELYKTN